MQWCVNKQHLSTCILLQHPTQKLTCLKLLMDVILLKLNSRMLPSPTDTRKNHGPTHKVHISKKL